ncbi:unnamed protein product [Chironomus riparius]|uniref:Solute carrier family 66 member 2 n=1 Tax=Chironomus riparius TaxID=315576 RepID=A0A9N9RGZ0_9DIPT|nr:unnamed protein product [Chironomus riparius]
MDWIISDEYKLTVGNVLGHLAAAAMICGGVLPYVPQYRQIYRTQDPEGFSLHVCLALLIANTLRIFFWFSKRYELPLLIQSVVMNITMFLMIHLCVKVRRNNAIMRARERVFSDQAVTSVDGISPINKPNTNSESRQPSSENTVISQSKHYISDFDSRYFWAWTDFQSYLDFLLVVWAVGAAVTYIMLPVNWFMEMIGFLAVFTEAMLGAPQFLRNYRNKSTHGMSFLMVIMWTIGDVYKTTYFILRSAPIQFWLCGMLQVSLDLAILLQVYIFRKNPAPRSAHRGD